MLDGAAKIDGLFARAAELGMPALGITDHGYLFGTYEFWKKSKKYGVKPVIGLEAYLTPGTSRLDRTRVRWGDGSRDDVSGGGSYTHATLWSETTEGMHNLFRIGSLTSFEGHLYKPRADRELLSTYSRGLIASTGCPSSEVQTRLRLGQYGEALRAAAEFRDIFGRDNYYCELMDHGLEIERRVQEDLLRIAKDLKLPLVASNDLHYTCQADARAHAALLCVQSGSTLADPKRFKFDADNFHLWTAQEMREKWRDFPEACDNTLAIAERCNVTFAEGANLMPRFPVPSGESEESWFLREVERGLARRFPGGLPRNVRERADYETSVICTMGFPGYFLVTADLIGWAKARGIRVGPGRGSAAGSLVAYAMGITELDPLRHGLLFERFLNPERISMPDIDIDFDESRRNEVIKYVTDRYGDERVAQIVTYGTIKAKQALKDAARVLGHPFAVGDRLTSALPAPVMGKDIPLTGAFDPQHERYDEAEKFREIYETDDEAREVVDLARGLEGLKRQWGVHACAVIMSSEPLIDHIPVMRRDVDGATITQYDYPACEALGLLKMDFLGLRNLTIIDNTLRAIVRNGKAPVDLDIISRNLDDPTTYELLAKGDTLGVFQLDSAPMRGLLRMMRPDRFEDISAVLALYRPGPMSAGSHTSYALRKNGQQSITPIHPELAEPLAEILDTTYGLIVYQEQVMAIAQKVAGYSLARADLLRKAMGKKKREILDKEFPGFREGMRANGYSDDAINTLWQILVPFSEYAFNKAHTAGYGLVSYWTAYLKANYPVEYMTSVLTSVSGEKDKTAIYLSECRRMGIKVLPPDVNVSDPEFTASGNEIRFGLSSVRNVGEAAVAAIITTREDGGRFASFGDFLRRVPGTVRNRKVVDSLIKGGAFDSFGHTRRGLADIADEALALSADVAARTASGQVSLFEALDDEQDVAGEREAVVPEGEWGKRELLAFEREMLGLYVSDHPLSGCEGTLSRIADCTVASIHGPDGRADSAEVTLAGIISVLDRKVTRRGKPWATATVEDTTGGIEVLFFPSTYELVTDLLGKDLPVAVRGRISRRDKTPVLFASDVTPIDLGEPGGAVRLFVESSRCTPPVVTRLAEILTAYPGDAPVLLTVRTNTSSRTLARLAACAPSPNLFARVRALLGPSSC
jgi:DNA polymerase-3 subunit alpha